MKQILGIDVGGTKIAIGIVNQSLKINDLRIVPTSQTNLLAQLNELIGQYRGYDGIGLALPGQVLADGRVEKLPNIKGFKPINIKQVLEKKFKVVVSVMNDAKAFALAEAMVGAGKDDEVVVGLILGTGVGAGVVVNGQVYFGKDGLAGEVEHVVLPDGKMVRYYRKAAGVYQHKDQTETILRTLLSIVILNFNPDIIVLGGGWSKLAGMEKLANKLAKNIGDYKTITKVKVSKIVHPGVIGAALPIFLGLKK
jgi:predicted NBD/HSP70 family sugar kinase